MSPGLHDRRKHLSDQTSQIIKLWDWYLCAHGSPVFLLSMPVTFQGVRRYVVIIPGRPVSPAVLSRRRPGQKNKPVNRSLRLRCMAR